jgi:membrane protein DedA with SNARE-associated domain
MSLTVPRVWEDQTSTSAKRLFLALAIVRAVMAAVALLVAPWLYREHAAVLVLLRPTKEVFLYAGFLTQKGDASLQAVVGAALPLLLAGVWLFFGLGRAYAEELEEAELPGVAGRILPKRKLDALRDTLDERGMWVVFLGRLAAFPSALMAAAAGSAGLSARRFIVADAIGALVSLAVLLAIGRALGEAYEDAGAWVTAAGVMVLVIVAVVLGRSLSTRRPSR